LIDERRNILRFVECRRNYAQFHIPRILWRSMVLIATAFCAI
jgi:hypothetical protein